MNQDDQEFKELVQQQAMDNFLKWGEYMKRSQIAERKVEKLKGLLLLTDKSVSNVVVGDTQIKQWNSFINEFPDEAKATEEKPQ